MICPHYSYYAVSEFVPEKFRNTVQDYSGNVSINIVAVNLKVEFHSYRYFQKVPTKSIRCRGHKLFSLAGSSAKSLCGKYYELAVAEQSVEEVPGRMLYTQKRKFN